MVDVSITPPPGVHRRVRMVVGLAGLSTVTAASHLIHDEWSGHSIVPYAVVGCVLTTISLLPMLARRAHTVRVLCWVVATLLVLLAVLEYFLGFYHFLPTALILFLAPWADSQRFANSSLACAASMLVLVTCSAWWASHAAYDLFAAPDAFVVSTEPAFVDRPDLLALVDGDGSGIGFGADSVTTLGEGTSKGPTLYVGFSHSLSTAGQARLRQRLLSLGEVAEVRLCDRWAGEC